MLGAATLCRCDYCTARRRLNGQGALVFRSTVPPTVIPRGTGGQRGPTLDSVAVRLTQDQLVRQVIQGRRQHAAYGKNLSPAETTRLCIPRDLHRAGQAPARDASRDAACERVKPSLRKKQCRLHITPQSILWSSVVHSGIRCGSILYLAGGTDFTRFRAVIPGWWQAVCFLD